MSKTQAFRRHQRLLSGADFSRVFQAARPSRDEFFTILVRPSDNPDQAARLGLAVAKRECRYAHDRNRIKRLARETFRVQQSSLRGWDIVLMTKRASIEQSNDELNQRLSKHWRRIASWPREVPKPRPPRRRPKKPSQASSKPAVAETTANPPAKHPITTEQHK